MSGLASVSVRSVVGRSSRRFGVPLGRRDPSLGDHASGTDRGDNLEWPSGIDIRRGGAGRGQPADDKAMVSLFARQSLVHCRESASRRGRGETEADVVLKPLLQPPSSSCILILSGPCHGGTAILAGHIGCLQHLAGALSLLESRVDHGQLKLDADLRRSSLPRTLARPSSPSLHRDTSTCFLDALPIAR